MLINLKYLLEYGDLTETEYQDYLHHWNAAKIEQGMHDSRVDYDFLWKYKRNHTLVSAFSGFQKRGNSTRMERFNAFKQAQQEWLNSYTKFMALKDWYGWEKPWNTWEDKDKFQKPGFENHVNDDVVEMFNYLQFIFDEQITNLKKKAQSLDIEIIGDLPMYPAYDSSDVWANQDLFQLDKKSGRMNWVAAVPPDNFNQNGQLWGFPLYSWGLIGSASDHKKVYSWWLNRFKREFQYVDLLKLDHFRGFIAYGRVKASEQNAKHAKWIRGPGEEFFNSIQKHLGALPFIAEDLGFSTLDVHQLQKKVAPGMKVFLFSDLGKNLADNTTNPNLPHNLAKDPNSVYYTGTHDNRTLLQWFNRLKTNEKKNLTEYLSTSPEKELNWQVIDRMSASQAQRVIFPMQDILFLGRKARMNQPGKAHGQWHWRMSTEQMKSLPKIYGKKMNTLSTRNNRN